MVENFKAAIRPGLAVWAASLLTAAFALQMPVEAWVKTVAIACIAEWIGERGIKRAREILK